MKKPEKLFLLINEINDRFVDEAKDKAEKPVSVRLESRMPIKEIIAFAACFAVLAVGIFALVKFKLNSRIDPQPVDNDSSNQSFELNSNIELEYTEHDKELQAILKDLAANAGEINGMFYQMSIISGEPTIKSRWADYYIIPDDLRTEPSGLNVVPQTYDEMEKLINKYFSKRAADFYLSSSNVCKASITKGDDGTITVRPDDKHAVSNPTFVEIDGKLYRSGLDWDTHGLNLGIDCDTARLTRKNDRTIEFTYWGYDYENWYDGGDVYAERNGAIVYEDGAWKLNYFYRNGFIPEMPNEYTEQDLELQKILESLARGDELSALFSANSVSASGEVYNFILPGDYEPEGSYIQYIDVSDPQPQEYYKQPRSLDELEQMLLEYFTEEKAANYMNRVCKGTMTDNGDGTYTVTLDKDVFFPVYIEIDGKMFYWTSTASGSGGFNDTAKVVEWTDDTITYTYVGVEPGGYGIWDGTLKFERGGWKFGSNKNEVNFSADDKELQGILSGMLDEAREVDGMFQKMSAHGDGYTFKCNNTYETTDTYYPVTNGLRTEPNGLLAFPQNRSEAEVLLSKYFSERAVKTYMNEFSTGSMTRNSDGTYTVETDSGHLTSLIEIDGKLFYSSSDYTQELDFDPTTAKVSSKTDKTIKFNFTPSKDWLDSEGALVFENDGWKLNYFYWDGFIPEYPTEFTAEDEELQKILEELAPNYTISGWFNTAGEYSDAYYFEFPELDSDYITFYYKLPTGTFANGKEKYPQSYDELEALLLKYFTQETVDYYMERVCRGTKTEISNENFSYSKGSYSVTIDRQITDTVPRIIEIDDEMYYEVFEKSGSGSPNYDTAKVISKTDNSIDFSYVQNEFGYYETSEKIKFERGGWKFD